MNARIKTLWVKALRSGKYVQGHDGLRKLTPTGPHDCCLGVLCDLFVAEQPDNAHWEAGTINIRHIHDEVCLDGCSVEWEGEETMLPVAVFEWAGIGDENPILGALSASEHNDGGKAKGLDGKLIRMPKTFAEIATLIEEHL